MTDELLEVLQLNGYQCIREMPDGRIVGVLPMAYTWGLCVGLDEFGIASRYCYEHKLDAELAALSWNGAGDPPGPWIKHKGAGRDKLGPGAVGMRRHE